MFGLFEHRMSQCLNLMVELSGYADPIKGGAIEKTHFMLTKVIGGKEIIDIDHLTVIRNIMAHSDGIAVGYHAYLGKNGRKTDSEKRLLQTICRAQKEMSGLSVNDFDGVLMDDTFLMYAVSEMKRYIGSLEIAVQAYHKTKNQRP